MKSWEIKLHKIENSLLSSLERHGNFRKFRNDEARAHFTNDTKKTQLPEFALSPARQILISLLMLYLSGDGFNLFIIFFAVQSIVQPVLALLDLNHAFKRFEEQKTALLRYKLIYAGIHFVVLGIGVYRLYMMGLLSAGF